MTQANWYPDPQGPPGQLRWFDGTNWTDHVESPAPPPPPQSAPPLAPTAPQSQVAQPPATGAPAAAGFNVWTSHDEAIYTTWEITGFLAEGITPPQIAATFALTGGPGEVLLIAGDYTRKIHGTGGPAKESGRFTPAAVRGVRKLKEMEGRRERWRPMDKGEVFVSTNAYYLRPSKTAAPWCFAWGHVNETNIVSPRLIETSVNLANGNTASFQIESDWAELIFLLWAFAYAPQHPQIATWTPPGWRERADAAGRDQRSITNHLFGGA